MAAIYEPPQVSPFLITFGDKAFSVRIGTQYFLLWAKVKFIWNNLVFEAKSPLNSCSLSSRP